MRGKRHDLHGDCAQSRWRHFECQTCGTIHSYNLRCGKRFDVQCKPCADAWRSKTKTKFKLGIENMRTPKFVTLTLKKGGINDVHTIWKARNTLFRDLRRRGYRIDGWLAVCEWPNHIHCVIDSDYVPQTELASRWLAATEDSYICDIRAIKDGHGRRAAINYVAKYLGKSQGWEDANLSLLKGFHLQNNHGLCLEKPEHHCPCDCGVGPLRLIIDMEFDHNQAFYVVYDDDT